MKNCRLKIHRILTIIVVSVSMMLVTVIFSSVLVHADTISDSSVQTKSNDNIVTGTWGTAPWTWNKLTNEITVGGGIAGPVADRPWKSGWGNDHTGHDQIYIKKIIFNGKLQLPANCSYLFPKLYDLTSIDGIDNLDTSKVTNMSGMFSDDLSLKSLNLSNFNTSNVIDMNSMIYNCKSLTYLNISNFDTSKVTDMRLMLGYNSKLSDLDVSNFDTSKVTDMSGMFDNDENIKELDVSNFNTSKVTNMSRMFAITYFNSLNLSNFDTSKVTDMNHMFYSASGLKSLDLRNFDTSKVTDMSYMFNSTMNLTDLNLSSFDTSKVTDMSYMFASYPSSPDPKFTNKLEKLNLSNFDMSNVTNSSAMFSKDSNLNTLILGKKNKFVENTNLPSVPTTDGYQGKWQNTKGPAGNNINNGNTYTSDDLLTDYTSDRAGTYTWSKKSNDVSDLKDLYNKVKLSISYSGSMFNSQPGDSMKYKDEFNGRSMFGALDYAYNSNNYDELIKVMHDSIKKTHESICSLQVNEAKAKELGLNIDQLKADLVKDSVPYDYSQDNDIDGINKQLDSFASVRAKYNKLVQEGVFDKSDYWTMNK
ncbi:BspA family leucine-rich repeat surface protein [Companilactobacillus nuruki]|uniref:BspA family leucine-rich repeat surface protein n=1 Tax=Companilactobacillus nuruki TaxID=1993540 RepID=UPI001416FF30|nr:BspA family leucine-rich repeat surface protein [Companilactobacillus nuruki]